MAGKNIYAVLTVFLLLGLMSWRSAAAQHPTGENAIFERLVQQGVSLDNTTTIKLPEPTLMDGLDGDQQRAVVTRISGRYGWKPFVRNSTVAPFMLRQAYVKNQQRDRIGHAIDLWFVAHAELATFQDRRLAEEFFGPKPTAKHASDTNLRELNNDELLRLGIKSFDRDAERYVVVEFPLMKRVQLRGIGHAYESSTAESVLVAWELAPGLKQDDDLGNRWCPIETTELGRRKRGAARPYQGYGGYLKITTLSEPQGALLFEIHVVFHEPEQWFHGSNFLRSKTPLIVKENVDKLRRKLAKAKRSKS